MSAILFGSISTIADTSELQREAFNEAFAEHGLDWHWDRDKYLSMLEHSGGANRIADYARSLGQDVDAAAVHQSKSRIFQERLAEADVRPRPGVVDTIKSAKSQRLKVALVTTTSEQNIGSLIQALSPAIERAHFDIIVNSASVEQPKPDKAAYSFALTSLDEDAQDCVAVEDNVEGVEAAAAAGVKVVAFPNENTTGHDFARAERRVDHVSFEELRELISARHG